MHVQQYKYYCTYATYIFSKRYSRISNLYTSTTVMVCLYVHTFLYVRFKISDVVTGKPSFIYLNGLSICTYIYIYVRMNLSNIPQLAQNWAHINAQFEFHKKGVKLYLEGWDSYSNPRNEIYAPKNIRHVCRLEYRRIMMIGFESL